MYILFFHWVTFDGISLKFHWAFGSLFISFMLVFHFSMPQFSSSVKPLILDRVAVARTLENGNQTASGSCYPCFNTCKHVRCFRTAVCVLFKKTCSLWGFLMYLLFISYLPSSPRSSLHSFDACLPSRRCCDLGPVSGDQEQTMKALLL